MTDSPPSSHKTSKFSSNMVKPTAAGKVDAALVMKVDLKIAAMRHLVSDVHLLCAMWQPDVRKSILIALRKSFSESVVSEISDIVSTEALLTCLRSLSNLLTTYLDQSQNFSAPAPGAYVTPPLLDSTQVWEIVTTVSTFDLPDYIDVPKVFEALLNAVAYATLHTVTMLKSDTISNEYRHRIDVIRSTFTHDALSALRKEVIHTVKGVVLDVWNKRKHKALQQVCDFETKYPIERLCRRLSAIIVNLEKQLGHLACPEQLITKNANTKKKKSATHKQTADKRSNSRGKLPSFFSDSDSDDDHGQRSIDMSHDTPVTPETRSRFRTARRTSRLTEDSGGDEGVNGHPVNLFFSSQTPNDRDPEYVAADVMECLESEQFLGSPSRGRSGSDSAPVQTPPAKRRKPNGQAHGPNGYSKSMVDGTEHDPLNVPEEPDLDDDSSRSRHSDSMNAGILNDSSDEVGADAKDDSESEDDLVNKEDVNEGGVKQYDEEKGRGEDSDADEDEGADESNDEDYQPFKKGRTTLRQLKAATTSLDLKSIPDPLPGVLADAQRATRRVLRGRRNLDGPGPTARNASPIGNSSPEEHASIIRRRKRISANLDKNDDEDFAESPAPSVPIVSAKRGRFQQHEDEWLIRGLRQFGWGCWALIAREYWVPPNTRSGMSLKDRARTLGLDREVYRKPGKRMEPRGRRSSYTDKSDGDASDAIEEDIDED